MYTPSSSFVTARRLLGCCVTAMACHTVQAAQDCEIGGVSVNPALNQSLRGKTGILRCTDRQTAALASEQELRKGRRVGLVRHFEDGQLREEYNVNLRGNKQGRAREFSPEGQVLREATYTNGTAVGLVRKFHPGGQLQRASVYHPSGAEIASVEFTSNGQLSALRCAEKPMLGPVVDDARACGFLGGPAQLDFYSEAGVLQGRARFSGGKRIGLDTFRADGKLVLQEESSPASRTERTFAPDGTKRQETQWTMAGTSAVRAREQEFSPTGVLLRERGWHAGELASETVYYLNGQLRRKAEYSGTGPTRVLLMSEYYENGTLSNEGAFANTRRYALTPVGVHRRYDIQGNLRSESTYDERGRATRDRNFDESGQLLSGGTLSDDMARKIYAK